MSITIINLSKILHNHLLFLLSSLTYINPATEIKLTCFLEHIKISNEITILVNKMQTRGRFYSQKSSTSA